MHTLSTEFLRGASLANGKVPVSNAQNSLRKNTRGKDVWMLSLLGLAACGSSSIATPGQNDPSGPANETVDNLYSTIEISGSDLAQIDFRQFSLDSVELQDGAGGTLNLGGLTDADGNALAQIIQDDNGEFAVVVSRPAVYRESGSFSANDLKLVVTEGTSYIDEAGETKTVENGGLIANDSAFSIKRAEILISQVIPDAAVATNDFSTTEYDLNAAFISAGALTFSVTVDGETVEVTNGILRAVDFPAGEVGAIHTVVVTAQGVGDTTREQTFTVERAASVAIDSTIDVSTDTITITDGQGKAAVDIELPFSGGDGEITYELSGERTDGDNNTVDVEAEYLIADGSLYISSEVNALFTLTASDEDGDTNTVVIDYSNVSTQLQVANPIDSPTLTAVYSADNPTISFDISDVFHIDGEVPLGLAVTLRGPAGTRLTGNNLTIDKSQLDDGQHSLILTAYANGQISTHEIVLGITLEVALDGVDTLLNQTLGLIDETLSYNLDDMFIGTGEIAYEVSSVSGFQHIEQAKTLLVDKDTLGVGTHTVQITATDSTGTKITETLTIALETNTEPMAKSDIVMDLAGGGGNFTVDVADQFSSNGNGNTTYAVDKIDGTEFGTEFRIDETSLNFTNGLLEIEVTASDADNENATATITLHEDAAPTLAEGAAVATQNLAANANLDIAVDVAGLFTHIGKATLTYAVSAGAITADNETISINANLLDAGENIITVIATDADGGTDADSVALEFAVSVADSEVVVGAALGNQNARDFNHAITYDISSVFTAGNFTNNHDSSLSTYAYTTSNSFVSFSGDELIVKTNGIVHGTHTINVTATDKDGDTATSQFELVLDEAIDTQSLAANTDLDLAVDVAAMFAHLQDSLDYRVSAGAISANNQTISINADDLNVGESTFTVFALSGVNNIAQVLEFTVNVADSLVVVDTPITAQSQRDTDQMYTFNLSNVFSGGNFTNNSDGSIYNYTSSNSFVSFSGTELIVDTSKIVLGTHAINVTATDKDGDTASSQFNLGLTANSVPVAKSGIIMDRAGAGGNVTVDVTDQFDLAFGDGTITYAVDGTLGYSVVGTELRIVETSLSFTDGLLEIEVTASDADNENATATITLYEDAAPTLAEGAAIATQSLAANANLDLAVDIASLFDHVGGATLTYAVSAGAITGGNQTISINANDLVVGTNTIKVTATDTDASGTDSVEIEFAVNVADSLVVVGTAITAQSQRDTDQMYAIDLSNVFSGGNHTNNHDANLSTYTYTSSNAFVSFIGDELIFDTNQLGLSTHAISVTATDKDGDTASSQFNLTLTANSVPVVDNNTPIFVHGAKQHLTQTIDVSDVFTGGDSTAVSIKNPSAGIALANGILTITNAAAPEGDNLITLEAEDADGETAEFVVTYSLRTIKDGLIKNINADGHGTTLADQVTSNNAENQSRILNGKFFAYEGDDSISSNTFNSGTDGIETLTLDGGEGDDTIGSNSLIAANATKISLLGQAGADSITANNISSTLSISVLTIDGGTDNDTITMNEVIGDNISNASILGSTGEDTIMSNKFTATGDLTMVDLDGGDGNDTISGNQLTANRVTELELIGAGGMDSITSNIITTTLSISTLIIDGGTENDTITGNNASGNSISNASILGGAGTDSITNNILTAANDLSMADIDGGTGDDTISGNQLSAARFYTVELSGADGEDSITSNTFNTSKVNETSSITIDGGVGDDTISENTFTATNGATSVLLLFGGDGNDTFANNTATSAGLIVSTITVDGGAGSDTLAIGVVANTDHTLDIAAVSGFDFIVESADTIWNVSNVEKVQADAAFAFNFTGGTGDDNLTASITNTAASSTLTIAVDGGDGTDTLTLGSSPTMSYTLSLESEFDLAATNGDTTWNLSNVELVQVDATFAFNLAGGTGDDALSDNSFSSSGPNPTSNITIDGGGGNDTISRNTFSSATGATSGILLLGGAGDDTFEDNTAMSAGALVSTIAVDGGTGSDTLAIGVAADIDFTLDIAATGFDLTATSTDTIWNISNVETVRADDTFAFTLAGGTTDDTISGNTFASTGSNPISNITIDGGGGDDTISGNAFTSTTGATSGILLLGGAGNDTFENNTATSESLLHTSTISVDGGDGADILKLGAGNPNFDFDLVATGFTFSIQEGNTFWHVNNVENVQIYDSVSSPATFNFTGGASDDTLTASGTKVGSSVPALVVDGGAGTDTLILGDTTNISYTLDITAETGFSIGAQRGGDKAWNIDNVEQVQADGAETLIFSLTGGGGNDTLSANSTTRGGSAPLTIDVNGGVGTDSITLGDDANIVHTLDITASAGFDLTATKDVATWNIDNVENVQTDANFALDFAGGTGSDTLSVGIEATTGSPAVTITIDGGGGADKLTLADDDTFYTFFGGDSQSNFMVEKDDIFLRVINVEELHFDYGRYLSFGSGGIAPEPPKIEPPYELEPSDPDDVEVPFDPYG